MSPVLLGWIAVGCYLAHALFHIARGRAADALWVCHLASLFIGVGLLISEPRATAVGVLWLSVGTPLWVWETFRGQEFLPTSMLTHVAGLVVGIAGLAQLGMPSGVWWVAAAVMLSIHLISRRITPPADNINMAHSVHPAFRSWVSTVNGFVAGIVAVFTPTFFLVERLLVLVLPQPATE